MTKHPVYHRLLQIAIILLLVGAAVRQIDRAEAQGPSFPAQMNKSFTPISIAAGGTSTLSVTIFNPNIFALILSTTPPAWTDTLPAGLNFASPPNTTTTCGGIVSAIGNTLSLSGGTVPAQVGVNPGSCTVTVDVTSTTAGNLVNTILANTLIATDPTGTIPVTNTTPASATLQVNAVHAPTLSKGFVPNTIWIGQTSTLTITIRNNDPNYAITRVSLTDNLPANVTVASPPASPQCGGGTVTSTATSITLGGGSIAKSGTCNLVVTVTSVTPGTYTNTIPANAIQTQQGVTNAAAATAPLNVQSVGITKSFSPVAFQQGGTSTVTITLQNPTSSPYTGAAFTDNLPAGVTVSSPPSSPQCSGTVTSTATSVSLSAGIIPAGSILTPGTCTITFMVTSSTPATYTNSIPPGALTTDQHATNVLAATANLTVYATGLGVSGSKGFAPNVIPVGGVSRLTINITAPADTRLTNFTLSDALPTHVQVAGTPNPTTTNCGSLSFDPAAGDTLLSASGGTILAGTTCALAVNVTSDTPNPPGGTYTNIISPANISDNENRNLPNNITANLTVSGLSVSKTFFPPTVNPDGISTLTISLTNANTSQLDNVSLTDTLPGDTSNGVVIAPTPNATTTCPLGIVTVGTQTISLTGAVIPAQVGAVAGLCTINVDVVGKGNSATYTNSIPVGAVPGTIHGTSIVVYNPAAANANLTIAQLRIGVNKSFTPVSVFGGSASTLTVLLSNPNNTALAGISFTDNLPQGVGGGMMIANPPNFSVGTCGGSLSGIPGNTSFSFSGGSLAANASCSLTLSVTMNVNANLTNTIQGSPTGGDVHTSNGAFNDQPTAASLTNLPGASVSKFFAPNPIFAGAGNTATLTITIQNTSNFQLDAMGLSDIFPAGMMVASPPASPQCGGTITSTANSVTLTGGVLAGSSTCTIVVIVTAPAAGNYQNCITKGALIDNQGATNQSAACDTLGVNQVPLSPSMTKSFAPNPIAAGGTSVLTFTITNPPANSVPLTGVGFTDTFPAGVTVASVPNPAQCGGSVSSTPNSITLTGGTIAVNSNCAVRVSVTAPVGGSYPNTSGAVTSTNGGTGNTASATLTVIAPPAISKSFAPNPILAGSISTLTFTITNPNAGTTLTGVAFTDVLPSGVQVAAPPNASTAGCNASSIPIFLPATADTSLSFSSGSIAGGGTCRVNVDVTAGGGSYPNTSSPVSSTNGGTGNTATDRLTVTGVGLALAKSTTTFAYQAAGDTINYSYLLTNTGTATLYAPFQVTDDHIGIPPGTPFDCGSATIVPPLANVTCAKVYTVTAADVTAKSVTNTATATAMDAPLGGNTVTSNPDSVTVDLESLTLDKTTSTTGYRVAGNLINYSYTLTNTGKVTLVAPFQVSDDHIGSPLGTPFSCGSATSVPPLANVTCAKVYTVTAADVTAGFVTNLATATAMDATGNTVTSNPDSVTVYQVQPPSIIKAFAPNPIAVGEISVLTFTITNPDENVIPLTGVGFSDTFPAGVIVAAAPNPAQCGGVVTNGASSITLTGGTILANSFCTVTVSVTATTSGIKNNTSGVVTSTNGGSGNTASATLTVIAPPTISKAFSPSTITVGGTSTVIFTLANPAANTVVLTGVGFTDNFPTSLHVANPPNASTSAGCGAPAFAPGAGDTTLDFSGGTIAVSGTCTVMVDVTAPSAGTYNNTTGLVSSTNGGTGATSNTATLIVNELVDLAVTKNDGKIAVTPGEAVTYTIVVNNFGPSDATGTSVSDLIPALLTGAIWTCTPDSGASCTASGSGNISDTVNIPVGKKITYTLSATVADTAPTDIVNSATVTPPVGVTDSNINNNIATDIDTLNLLNIAKSANPATYATVGTIINYTYTITNTGTSTLSSPFAVVDNKLTPACSPPASLAPEANFTCTASHTITQADLDAGSITNHVTATGQDADHDTVTSNTATRTVTATQNPVLILAKSITLGSPYSAVGNTVNYLYTLTNNGNVTLSAPFEVTDDHIGSPTGTPFACSATATLAPGANLTCTAAYTVVQADLDAGHITNTASGTGHFNTSTITSNTDHATATASQNPVLTLAKSITSGSPYSAVGNTVNYLYTLTNNGNVTLSAPFEVADDHIGSPTGTPFACSAAATLAPGANLTCTAAYTVVQADLDAGHITNTASGTGHFNTSTITSNTDHATATASQSPDLSVVKSQTSSGPYILGDTIHYSILVTNTGNITLTNVTASDSSAIVGTCAPAQPTSLAPLASMSCPATHVVTQADINNGSYSNTATGKSDQARPKTSTVTVIFGTSSNSISGTVFNDANNNGIQDIGELGLAGVTVTLYDQSNNVVATTTTGPNGGYSFINLPPGIYTVVETNPAGYVSTTLDHVTVVLSSGTHAVVNFGDLQTVASVVDPAVTKFGNPSSAVIGDTVIFTITVGNNGNADALNVVLTDTTPSFLNIISINISPNHNFPVTISSGDTFTISFGTVTPTDFYTVTVVTVVNHLGAPPGGDNNVSITTSSPGDPIYNDQASAHITILRNVLPGTGFSPGAVTSLAAEPDHLYETSTDLAIEIPTLGVRTTIVGVPKAGGTWDVSWLGDQVGYLEGTAFPTWSGNSVVTGHVYGADGLPGPFVNLNTLKWGDQVIIHFTGQRYIFEVRTNEVISPTDTSIFSHKDYPWLTLLTCKDYNARTNSYAHRVAVGAVLIKIESDPPPGP